MSLLGVVLRNKLFVVFVVAGLLATGVAEARTSRRRVAKGVMLTQITKRRPNLRIKVARIDKRKVDQIRAALGSGELPGWERTSSIARRNRAIVAINGDYGRSSGRPVMAFAHSWRLRQTPLTWGRNFALSHGSKTYIGHPRLKTWVNIGGEKLPIPRVNHDGPYGNQLAMFDDAGGRIARPPKRACSVRVKPSGLPRSDRSSGSVFSRFRVQRVSCKKGRLFPMGGRVISARWNTPKAAKIRSLRHGSNVWVGWTMGWGSVREAIGGNPTLMEAGKIVVGRSSDPFFARHPRTGVGVTRSGDVLLATVDGRQRKSIGMTLRGFAKLFRSFGARWALNLDGGGSTTMVVRGKVMNRPSDGSERPVSSALVVLSGRSPRKGTPAKAVGREAWTAAARDDASTGGLASMLDARGMDLPADLERAARR